MASIDENESYRSQPVTYEALQEATDRFGEATAEFRSALANSIAGIILGLLCVAGAAGSVVLLINPPAQAKEDLSKNVAAAAVAITTVIVIGLVFLGLGLGTVVWSLRSFRLRVVIYPKGFVFIFKGKMDTCAWDQIDRINEIWTWTRYHGMPIDK